MNKLIIYKSLTRKHQSFCINIVNKAFKLTVEFGFTVLRISILSANKK